MKFAYLVITHLLGECRWFLVAQFRLHDPDEGFLWRFLVLQDGFLEVVVLGTGLWLFDARLDRDGDIFWQFEEDEREHFLLVCQLGNVEASCLHVGLGHHEP